MLLQGLLLQKGILLAACMAGAATPRLLLSRQRWTQLVQTTAGALRLPSPCQLGVFLTQQTPTHVFMINFIKMHSNTKPAFMLAEPKQGLCPQEGALNCFSTSLALATCTTARGGKRPPRQPSHTVLPPFCSIPWAPHLPTELLRPSVRAIPA